MTQGKLVARVKWKPTPFIQYVKESTDFRDSVRRQGFEWDTDVDPDRPLRLVFLVREGPTHE